jgi:hypothetical protein
MHSKTKVFMPLSRESIPKLSAAICPSILFLCLVVVAVICLLALSAADGGVRLGVYIFRVANGGKSGVGALPVGRGTATTVRRRNATGNGE